MLLIFKRWLWSQWRKIFVKYPIDSFTNKNKRQIANKKKWQKEKKNHLIGVFKVRLANEQVGYVFRSFSLRKNLSF